MAKLFTVNTILPKTILNTNGTFEDVQEITFTTVSGIPGTLNIPIAQFNKDTAEQLLTEKASELEHIKNL